MQWQMWWWLCCSDNFLWALSSGSGLHHTGTTPQPLHHLVDLPRFVCIPHQAHKIYLSNHIKHDPKKYDTLSLSATSDWEVILVIVMIMVVVVVVMTDSGDAWSSWQIVVIVIQMVKPNISEASKTAPTVASISSLTEIECVSSFRDHGHCFAPHSLIVFGSRQYIARQFCTRLTCLH